MAKKRKPSLPCELKLIPPNAFLVFRTRDPKALCEALEPFLDHINERGIKGVVVNYEVELQELSTTDLADMGLQRIPRLDLH